MLSSTSFHIHFSTSVQVLYSLAVCLYFLVFFSSGFIFFLAIIKSLRLVCSVKSIIVYCFAFLKPSTQSIKIISLLFFLFKQQSALIQTLYVIINFTHMPNFLMQLDFLGESGSLLLCAVIILTSSSCFSKSLEISKHSNDTNVKKD